MLIHSLLHTLIHYIIIHYNTIKLQTAAEISVPQSQFVSQAKKHTTNCYYFKQLASCASYEKNTALVKLNKNVILFIN